jgi:hypothetical protein
LIIDASIPSQDVPLINPIDVTSFFISNYFIYNYYCVKVILNQTIYEK